MADRRYLEPARTVVARFGGGDISRGVAAISAILNCDASWVYKWMYPKDRRGRGGSVPESVWPALLEGARALDVQLSLADLSPALAPFLPHPPSEEAA